jgi:hypothetical protein
VIVPSLSCMYLKQVKSFGAMFGRVYFASEFYSWLDC